MKIWQIAISCIVAIALVGAVRGYMGNPSMEELNTNYWREDGPLELSPERGRFALVYSVVEDASVHFSLPVARFATPDLGYINGNFVSLFAPGVSYLVIPGYVAGHYFGAAQFGTFAIISLCAFINFVLVAAIARQMKVGRAASLLGGIIFLCASPAFAYAVTLYQHHVTVLLLLLCIYLLLKFKKSVLALLAVWFLCALSLVVDYPNLFLFFPVGVFALLRAFPVFSKEDGYVFSLKFSALFSIIMVIFPLAFFLWFNQQSYGDPLQFSGTVQSVQNLSETGDLQYMTGGNEQQVTGPQEDKTSISFFETREMLNGMYTLLLSDDRGTLIFSPIILFGFAGFYFAYKKHTQAVQLLLSICLINLLLYSMWGDPWGGWAFGARYMIPSYAMLGVGCAYLFHSLKKNYLFLLVSLPIIGYSLAVNTLGALTTNRIPPKIEAQALQVITGRHERYGYGRSYEFLQANESNSFLFTVIGQRYFTAMQYYLLEVGVLGAVALFLISRIVFIESKADEK